MCLRHNEDRDATHLKMLLIMLVFAAVSFTLNVLFGVVLQAWPVAELWVLAMLMAALGILCLLAILHKTHRRTLYLYIAVALSYLYALALPFFAPSSSGPLLLCVMLAVMPNFVVDRYGHTVLPGTLAFLLYMILSVARGSATLPEDSKWVVCCWGMGLLLGRNFIAGQARIFMLGDQLRHQRDTDGLTHLSTRSAAEARVRAVLADGEVPCTMLIADIDAFKQVNDSYGHDFGDKVLETVAAALQRRFRRNDCVCRLGGDEFLIFAVGTNSADFAMQKGASLVASTPPIKAPNGAEVCPILSVGAALFPQHGGSFEELYRCADQALYEAKRSGKGTCRVYEEEGR